MSKSLTLAAVLIVLCSPRSDARASEFTERIQREIAEGKKYMAERRELSEQYHSDVKRMRKKNASSREISERTKRYFADDRKLIDARDKKKKAEAESRKPPQTKSELRTLPPSKPKPVRKPIKTKRSVSSSKSRTKYIFEPHRELSYAIDITKTRPKFPKQRWKGTLTFKADKGTSRRSDGSPYGSTSLMVSGSLKGYRSTGAGKWVRDTSEDIAFAKPNVVFATSGVTDYKLDKFGRHKLPADMHVRFGVMSAIFPTVPVHQNEIEESGDVARTFWLSPTYMTAKGGALGVVTGRGSFAKKSYGGKYTMNETFETDWKGEPIFTYATKQEAIFSGGEMISSSTVFAINWDGMAKVTVNASKTTRKNISMTPAKNGS